MLRFPSLIILSVTLGCAALPRDAGFTDVRDAVERRSGIQVQWPQDAAAERAIEARVAALLAEPLTADTAVEIALLNSRRVRATLEELGIARADFQLAARPRNPVLAVELRFPGRPRSPFELDLVQGLFDLLQLRSRRALAGATFEQAKLGVAAEIQSVVADVRAAFVEVQAADATTRLSRAITDAAASAAELAVRQHAAGNISDLELETEQLELEQAELDQVEREQQALAARERLDRSLGLGGDQTRWRVTAELPELPPADGELPELEAVAVKQRLDLLAAEQQVIVAARGRPLARSEAWGELAAGVHHEREPEGTSTTGPHLELPIPLFDRGRPARGRAAALLRQAEHRYAALTVEVRSDVREALRRLAAARSRVEYHRDVILPRRQRIVAFSQQNYNFMLLGAPDLLRARQSEIAAQRDAVAARRDYWVARADLERAVGGRLEPMASPLSPPPTLPSHDHGDDPS